MWQNRIYADVRRYVGMPDELASTIAHEVNHVLNRSEENH